MSNCYCHPGRGGGLPVLFNAIAYATEDPEALGTYLRPRTEKNRHQYQDFLDEVEPLPQDYAEIINCFRGLPLLLELPGLRVIHACWEESSNSPPSARS